MRNGKNCIYGTKKTLALSTAAAAASLLPAFSPTAQAALLTYDLRVVGGGKNAIVAAPGEVVNLELYALVQNLNPANADGFRQAHGSFKSSPGGLLGNLAAANVSPFNASPPAQPGTPADLDADGDLDVGTLATAGSIPSATFFIAGSGLTPITVVSPLDPVAFLIGTATFTVGSSGLDGGSTLLNFIPRVRTDGTVAGRNNHIFVTDGTSFSMNGDNLEIAVGQAVSISAVPEPASLSLLGMGALAMLGRRRRTR